MKSQVAFAKAFFFYLEHLLIMVVFPRVSTYMDQDYFQEQIHV